MSRAETVPPGMSKAGKVFPARQSLASSLGLSTFGLSTLFSAILLSVGFLGGCTTNPATGKTSLVALSSAQDDARIGADAHPKIIAAYGGVYDDPGVGAYVAKVTQRIVSGTPQPNQPYRVT